MVVRGVGISTCASGVSCNTVEFGIFHEFERPQGVSEAQAFDNAFELIDVAERGGLDAVWLAELHFSPERSVLASPMLLAAAIGAAHQPYQDRYRGAGLAAVSSAPDRRGGRHR